MKTRFNRLAIALALSAVPCLPSAAYAVNGTWDGGVSGGGGAWGTSANWVGDPILVPGGAGSIVTFLGPAAAGARTITLDENRIVGVLNLGTSYSNYTLSTGTAGGQLTFNNSGSTAKLNSGGYNFRFINAPVILADSLDIDSGADSRNNTEISGSITAAGGADAAKIITHNAGVGLLKISGVVSDGTGLRKVSVRQNFANSTLSLTGSNTFTGGVEVSAGLLQVGTSSQALGTGTLKLNGGDLEIASTDGLNFGNNTEIVNDANINIRNGATGSGKIMTFGTLTVGNKVTFTNTGGALSAIPDTLIFGSTTLTANSTFSVEQTGLTIPVLRLGALNGTSNLTKTGNGAIDFSAAAGTYSGTTILNAGTMIVGNNTALGTGKAVLSGTSAATLQIGTGITTANNIVYSNTNAASTIQRVVSGSSAFNVGTTGTLSSEFAGGQPNTTAALRAGNAATTLTMSFADASAAANDGIRISDVFKLTLTGTPTYVLQLSTGDVGSGSLYLGWLDGGSWIEATSGNTGAGALAGQYASTWDAFVASNGGAFNATTMLGAYGYDATTTTAWAVLNHSSDYALVVPEPSTAILMGLGLGLTLFGFRRRVRQS